MFLLLMLPSTTIRSTVSQSPSSVDADDDSQAYILEDVEVAFVKQTDTSQTIPQSIPNPDKRGTLEECQEEEDT
ncbi:hypothetical protein DPMN_111805 [Dreissena polymorpha]|uniref:Uncharacterized protein n=1 Tax=Dreissena polymorpha TaxID=45954 RepID=A0A9D4QP62_DREPO|nr:hypothetical protein DPMN_111805 [Dreissena polymorpha]